MGGVEAGARPFLWVCMPIVVIGAPLGAICDSYLHPLTLAWLVYFIDAAQLIGALPRRLSMAGRYQGKVGGIGQGAGGQRGDGRGTGRGDGRRRGTSRWIHR